ncbi:amino acid transporter [Obba rivulosa]|uniref:Amino acid transporter n=1 Tax=Obba rivulosa TaxID=1052685 RepID=A0A8E2API0_9APHY|nr:amino acid transporter [Obba rivulosa]
MDSPRDKTVEHVRVSICSRSVDARSISPTISDTDAAALAQLGYKQEFRRAFSAVEVFGFAFGVVGLLPSMASVLAFAIPNGGPFALVWGWAVSVVFIMFISLTLAELGSAAPTSGGLYYWTFKYASPRYRRLLSWIVGYCNTIGLIAGLAGIDWGCAVQILAAVSIGSDMTFVPTTHQTFGIFVALLLCHGLAASLATRIIARLQWLYISLNIVLCLAVIIALPAATPTDFRNSASFAFGGVSNISGWPAGFAFTLSFLAPLWTIAGFDAPIHISEEASNARTAVPWAIILSSALAGVIGWGVNVAMAFCMGTDMGSIMASAIGQPMATIFFNGLGKHGTLAIWSFVVFTQFLMGINALIASSRQMFAFARDGALPFSSILYRMHPRIRTPVNCVWMSAFVALLLGLLALGGTAASSAIFSLGIAAQYFAFIIPIGSRFLGGAEWIPGPFSLGRWGLPVGVIAIAWMVFSVVIFTFPATPDPTTSSMNWMVVVLGAWMSLCLAYYYCPVYGGIHWFVGPKANVAINEVAAGSDMSRSFDEKET